MGFNIALLTAERSLTEIGTLGTIAGMLVVFLALILIALILSQFKHFNNMGKNRTQPVAITEPVKTVVTTEDAEELTDESDDLELVAVITAAIAASMNTTSDKLVVKSLRRLSNKSAWNATGRQENLQNNLF